MRDSIRRYDRGYSPDLAQGERQELKRRQLAFFVTWHFMATGILALAISPMVAVAITSVWMLSMFVILPVVRSIAEVGEHDYDRGTTEIETTFSNIGFWDHALFHPAGDAWHVLHHLYPTIPWWQQRQAHNFLISRDNAYRGALHRTSMIEGTAASPGHAASFQS